MELNEFAIAVDGELKRREEQRLNTAECPHCATPMDEDTDNLWCKHCGFILKKKWIMETADKIVEIV